MINEIFYLFLYNFILYAIKDLYLFCVLKLRIKFIIKGTKGKQILNMYFDDAL